MILEWDKIGERLYETGVDHVALYPMTDAAYGKGVAWNGVTALNEKPTGAEASPKYADNIKYLNMVSKEDFAFGIEAFTYPKEFAACDGSVEPVPGMSIGQQIRKTFGLAYRTLIGNDTEKDAHGYKIHIVYGCQAAPSEKSYATQTEDPDATTMSWECTTVPVAIKGHPELNPAAHIELDSTVIEAEKMKTITDTLFGTEDMEPKLMMPDEIITALSAMAASTEVGA